MPTSFDVRLVRYIPGGARQRVLTTSTITVDVAPGEMPVVRASVPEKVWGKLPDLLELAVEYWNGSAWAEPRNGRFFVNEDGVDDVAVTGMKELTGVGFTPWFMTKLPVFDPTDLATLVDGNRRFADATAGSILKTLLDEGVAAGWGRDNGWTDGISYDFTAARDSAGQPWAQQITIAYQPGVDAWAVLGNLYDQRMIDYAFEGRKLRVWNVNSGRDWTTSAPYVRLGGRARTVPLQRNRNSLVTDLLFVGEGQARLRLNNPSGVIGLGRLYGTVQQGGVSDPGTMTLLGKAALDEGAATRRQISVTEDAVQATYSPWQHYQENDWVQARVSGAWERLRVVELVVDKDAKGVVTTTAVLNDRYQDLLARLAKRTVGILGGAVAGGTGAVPSTDDNRAPKAPTGVSVSSVGYWDTNGIAQSVVALEWIPVEQNVADIAIDVEAYQVWVRLPDDPGYRAYSEVADPSARISPLNVGISVDVRVRARGRNGVWSAYSAAKTITTLAPTEVLEAPSTPTVSQTRGVVLVSWDGMLGDSAPPAQHAYTVVEMGESQSSAYSPTGGVLQQAGTVTVPNLEVGATRWFRLRAIDYLGRSSDPSNAVSITVESQVGDDIEQAVRDEIAAYDERVPVAERLAAHSITVDKLLVSDFTNLVQDPNFTADFDQSWRQSDGDGIDISIRQDAALSARVLALVPFANGEVQLDNANRFTITPGAQFRWGATVLNTSGAVGTIGIRWSRADGSTLGYSGLNLPAGSGWSEVSGLVAAPAGAHSGQLAIEAQFAAGSGQLAVSRPYINRASNGQLIVDGAVLARHLAAQSVEAEKMAVGSVTAQNGAIADLAVTNAKIESLHGSKITSNSVTVSALDPTYENFAPRPFSPNGEWPAALIDGGDSSTGDWYATPYAASDSGEAFTVVGGRTSTAGPTANVYFPVTPGEVLYAEARFRIDGTVTGMGQLGVGVKWRLRNGAVQTLYLLVYTSANFAGSGQVVQLSADAVVPTNARDARVFVHRFGTSVGDPAAVGYVFDYVLRRTPSRQGMKITPKGIVAKNASGATTFSVESGSGDVYTVGEYRTATDPGSVIIASNIYNARPGVRLHTGSSHAFQPTLQSLAASDRGYPAGATLLNGREMTANSSGRADLALFDGGGFALHNPYGSGQNVGIRNDPGSVEMSVRGRMLAGQHSHDRFVSGGTPVFNTQSGTYNFTYGQPAFNGNRRPIVTPDSQNQNMVTNSAAAQPSGFSVFYNSAGTGAKVIYYLSIWVP